MTAADAPHDWDGSYAGPSPPPPWDIGRPQRAFVRLADAGALTGALLDVGYGTGEHTILAARYSAQCARVVGPIMAVRMVRAQGALAGSWARPEGSWRCQRTP
jgi:hypothetical protein